MKPLPLPPPHSRWKILEEVDPDVPKRQAKRTFRVRCSCGSKIERVLGYRYVAGESLSCGCLVREKAAEIGRSNLDAMRVGYQEYLNRVWVIFPAALRRSFGVAIRILGFGSKSASIPRPLAAGFLIVHPKNSSKYGSKLPSTQILKDLRKQGLSCQEIADKYKATASAVSKRLRNRSLSAKSQLEAP